jgi:hypothetical protein
VLRGTPWTKTKIDRERSGATTRERSKGRGCPQGWSLRLLENQSGQIYKIVGNPWEEKFRGPPFLCARRPINFY